MKKKLYISLPVTSRKEQTIAERVQASFERCKFLVKRLSRVDAFRGWQVVTPFDVAPVGTTKTEAEIMGGCVQALLECDAVVFDFDYSVSKGCKVEETVALYYGKPMYVIASNCFKVLDVFNYCKPV